MLRLKYCYNKNKACQIFSVKLTTNIFTTISFNCSSTRPILLKAIHIHAKKHVVYDDKYK